MCIFADLGEKYAKMWNAQKWHFSRRSAVMKIIKFFDFLESLLKWWKSPPVDHRTLEMCIFADLGGKYAKMWNAQKWQFFAGPRSWKCSNFSTFWKAFKNDENHHQLTTGPLKCAYLLIWVRKMQKCEMLKNDIFLAGPRSWKSSNFFDFLESLLKWWKSPPVDHRTLEMCIFADLGEKYAKMWNAQKWHFSSRSAVMKIFKFFVFMKSLKKWWKSPPVDHRTLEMCIFADLGEKNAKMWNAEKWHFSRRSAVMKIFKFFQLSGKPFRMMKVTSSSPQDPWNVHICWFGWEICKNVKCPKMTFFSQVRGHENLQIFRLSGKPFKMMKITTSWPQDPWNVHICWFGWEKCEMPKNDIFLVGPRSWKSSNFFDFLESL